MEHGSVVKRANQMHNDVRATFYEAGSETTPTWGWLGEPPSQEYAGLLRNKGLEILTQMCGAPRREQPKDLSRNQDYMSKFLEKNDKWCLPVIKGVDFTKVIPNGIPLLDVLYTDILRSDHGYKLPPISHVKTMMDNRSIDLPSLFLAGNVTVKEIDLVRSSSEERREFIQWMNKFHLDNQRDFPSGMLSVDVEDFVIPSEAIFKLKKAIHNQSGEGVPSKLTPYGAKDTIGVPARIIVGDGIQWFGSIRFPWNGDPHNKKSIIMDSTPITEDNELLRHLFSYTWVGQGIQNDRNNLMDFFSIIYGLNMGMPKVVELDALALAAGWRLDYSNMFVMNLVCCGGLLNKHVSRADNLWYKPYLDLPECLQAYIIGDVRCGYICHVVLSSLLIRDLFPDIDVVCSSLELLPEQWIGYFNTILVNVLAEKSIYQEAKKKAETRKDMLLSLREYDNNCSPRVIKKEVDARLEIFAKLLPVWPTVPYGGARSLHQVVNWFSDVQGPVLKELAVPHSRLAPILDRSVSIPLLEFSQSCKKMVFGRSKDPKILTRQQAVSKPGLVADTMYENQKFEIPISDLSLEPFKVSAEMAGTGIADGILETCRLYPYIIPELLTAIGMIKPNTPAFTFWERKCGLYDRIRQMYKNLHSMEAPNVTWMEDLIRKKRVKVLNVEVSSRHNSKRVERKVVIAALSRRAEEAGAGRFDLQKRAYQIVPRPNPENARKRARAQERKELEDKKLIKRSRVDDETSKNTKCSESSSRPRSPSPVYPVVHHDMERMSRAEARVNPIDHKIRFLSPSIPMTQRAPGPRYKSSNGSRSCLPFPREITPPRRSVSQTTTSGDLNETREVRRLPDSPKPIKSRLGKRAKDWYRGKSSSQSEVSSNIFSRLGPRPCQSNSRPYSPPRDWSYHIGIEDTQQVQRTPMSDYGSKKKKRSPHFNSSHHQDFEDEFVALATNLAGIKYQRRWK